MNDWMGQNPVIQLISKITPVIVIGNPKSLQFSIKAGF